MTPAPLQTASRGGFWSALCFSSVRHIETSAPVLFLTFDDGPDPLGTAAVLDLLKKHEAHATFFLIATKAKSQKELVARILSEGHTIGNHSLDHNYGVFFRGLAAMREWIQNAEQIFIELGVETVGFRPPAGARTPLLHRALMQLHTPLVMWRRRFFDTAVPFTNGMALRSLRRTRSGSIVLLHDRQRPGRLDSFLATLDLYICTAKQRGFQFRPLTVSICRTCKTTGMV